VSAPNRISILRDRAFMLERARLFFKERGVIEVDCPLLTTNASIDVHIDLIPALYNGSQTRYLHSSPEYGMKRLLVEGIGDCYQLAHVFRDGEYGRKHNPEFMMAEWYRLNALFEPFVHETLDFMRLFLGPLDAEVVTYREAFEKYLGINPFAASEDELIALLNQHEISFHASLMEEGKDAILNVLIGVLIEPHLGKDQLTVLQFYPASQAALAKTREHQGDLVACRFEVYYQGVELANGYDELADAKEQRLRLMESNEGRVFFGKSSLPLDEAFLAALEKGLPPCCGVAVGFDRLMMLRNQANSLADVISFDWMKS
jgi:lysyl-tRNA synthetase class 2